MKLGTWQGQRTFDFGDIFDVCLGGVQVAFTPTNYKKLCFKRIARIRISPQIEIFSGLLTFVRKNNETSDLTIN